MEKQVLGICFLLLAVLQAVMANGSTRPEVTRYEAAIMEEMKKLKETGADKQEGAIKAAMDRVEDLKPPDMEPTELIAMMGRVMQETMGLSIKVQDPTKTKEEKDKKEKEEKAKKKKEKKKKRKGPSLSNTGEL